MIIDDIPDQRANIALKYKTLPQQMKHLEVPYDVSHKYQIKSTSADFRDLILHVDP